MVLSRSVPLGMGHRVTLGVSPLVKHIDNLLGRLRSGVDRRQTGREGDECEGQLHFGTLLRELSECARQRM